MAGSLRLQVNGGCWRGPGEERFIRKGQRNKLRGGLAAQCPRNNSGADRMKRSRPLVVPYSSVTSANRPPACFAAGSGGKLPRASHRANYRASHRANHRAGHLAGSSRWLFE